MSRKTKRPRGPAAKPMAVVPDASDDVSILLPNIDIRIAGTLLTVREFTLEDSLTLHAELKPIITSLADVMQSDYPGYEAVMDVLAQHAHSLPLIVAHSCDQPSEWVRGLPAREGSTLIDVFWTANRRFFMSAAIRQVTIRAALKKPLDLAESLPR